MTSVFTNCVFRKEINLVSLYQATELYCKEDIKPNFNVEFSLSSRK